MHKYLTQVTAETLQEQQTREMDRNEGENIPAKKSRKSCKYLEKWESKFTFLSRSRIGDSHAFCKICNYNFSVSHGGRTDVRQHEKSTRHIRWLKTEQHVPPTSASVTKKTTQADQVINAELKMAELCAKNNVPFTFCDDFNKCVAEIFPDSAIARKYSMGKTKAMQLIKGPIAGELPILNVGNAEQLSEELGSTSHLAQLATGYAIREAQIPVEEILVGIYTHFDKRSEICEEFVDFTDPVHLKLLRYCSTRWQSLLTYIQIVLNYWDALQAYFSSYEEVEWSAKVHDLASHLHNPVMKIYFLFLTAALKPLSEFDVVCQSEEVQSHKLEEEMCKLIRRILGYLIPARAIVGVPLREVEYGERHQLPDEELFIGTDTKAFMKSIELPVATKKKIFQSVRRFYEAVLQKMFSSFPLNQPRQMDLNVLDPAACLDINPGTVERLGALFPQLSFSEDRLRGTH